MSPTVYLISGANRGIGLGLVTALAEREDTVVFAGARNPDDATALHALVNKCPGNIHIVKLTAGDEVGNRAAVAEVKTKAGRLDVVIANAAISQYAGPALQTPPEQMREHFEVNVVGTLVLFQAAYPLMQESAAMPKFVVVSSGSGSLVIGPPLPVGTSAYGTSKAAVNYLARKLHFEHNDLICFPMCPEGVATDMGLWAAADPGWAKTFDQYPQKTVEETVAGMLSQIDSATREKEGGQFVKWDGGRWPF